MPEHLVSSYDSNSKHFVTSSENLSAANAQDNLLDWVTFSF